MNILVIGSGGREHAICDAFGRSKQTKNLFCLPGNGGIGEIATNIDIKISDHEKIINFCQENTIDLVFVGPEQPLVEGLVDELQKNNICTFGPSKQASKLEGSKIFMKDLAKKYQIPTAKYESFKDKDTAINFAKELGFPCVIKTDGLAAGKGVIIAQSQCEAIDAINEIFAGKFGNAGNKIIIEEFLTGFEASYFVIADGKNYKSLGFAHDYKKIGEGDTGLNTGGMGTYGPSDKVNKEIEEKVNKEIITPTINALKQENAEFVGILFAGLMINEKNEPKLLEFNIRFGDPETQVILPRLKTDFVDLIMAATKQELDKVTVEFDEEKHAVCVVIAANGYPQSYEKGKEINTNETKNSKNLTIFHAGTKITNNILVSNGGRVLNVVGFGANKEEARKNAYEGVDKVKFSDKYYRKDIAM